MTAEHLASMLHARPAGTGRWVAHCPSHNDRSPSLSIREGRHGRTLLHCHAGCPLDSILNSLKLARRDLFSGPPPSPSQRALLARQQAERDALARAQHVELARQAENLRDGEMLINRLGGLLMRDSENAELAQMFHLSCDAQHAREADLHLPQDGPRRFDSALDVPFWFSGLAQEISFSFRPNRKAASRAA